MYKISQLKEFYNIAAVVAPYTNGLMQHIGTSYKNYLNGWCPFCQNGHPQKNKARRFWVNVTTQTCNCMSPKCRSDIPMDVINFHARIHGITNAEAIRDLINGIELIKVIKQ